MIVGQLARQRREQEERKNEQPLRDGAELELLRGVGIELVGDEEHDGLLEEAVVEGAEELRREQRQEPPRAQQMGDVLNQGWGARAAMGMGAWHSQLCACRQTL